MVVLGTSKVSAVHGVTKSRTRLRDFTFTFHFHALEKEMATHSSVLAWRIPGTGDPGGLPSMGSHRVRHDWSDLAVAAIFMSFKELIWVPPGGSSCKSTRVRDQVLQWNVDSTAGSASTFLCRKMGGIKGILPSLPLLIFSLCELPGPFQNKGNLKNQDHVLFRN